MQDDLIAVTQADHERAAEIMRLFVLCGTRMDGREDYQTLLRQLAVHRQQAEDAMRERCAAIVENGFRCASCGAVFIDDPKDIPNGGHPNNGCKRPNWYKLEEDNQVAAIRATPPKPDRLNGEGE